VGSDWKARLARIGPDSFVAQGHAGGRYTAAVYASPEAKELAAANAPVGAEVVMATEDRSTRKTGPTFFMKKTETGWRFGVVERPEATAEQALLCARCHSEAPDGVLFPLPR
jgi:hypothetical protein